MPEDDQNTETATESEAPAAGTVGGLDDILASLDENGQKAVRAELKKARDEAARYRTRSREFADDAQYEAAKQALARVTELEESQKTEAQKAADRATRAEQERDAARTELLRHRVGAKHKLPASVVALLTGSSEEEMEERASQIATELGEARARPGDSLPSTPKPTNSPGAGDSEQFDPNKIAEQALASM